MQERLHKIMAAAGVASRRKSERLIADGQVTVNGQVVTRIGILADRSKDHIKVNGKKLRYPPLEYFLVNKPQGVLSAAADSSTRPLVTDLVKSKCRLYPAGRLDFQSEGLVILTNDGKLAERITRSGVLRKVYKVKVRGVPTSEQLSRLAKGIHCDGEQFERCRIKAIRSDQNTWYEVMLKQGKNRQIRRMFDSIGHPVMRLRRIAVGPLVLKGVGPGHSRRMTHHEVERLKAACLKGRK